MPDSGPAEDIRVVGPTHPFTGGIAQHTTRLALELEAGQHSVTVESWKAQYPKALYRATAVVPGDKVEIGLPQKVNRKLTWYNPASWLLAGWRGRKSDAVVFNIPTPIHALIYVVVGSALGRKPRRIAILHNVLPHERLPGDEAIMRFAMRSYDRVIVHSSQQLSAAKAVGVSNAQLLHLRLPNPWPEEDSPNNPLPDTPTALFFGTVRHYKGLDILLRALAKTDRLRLIIAGEFWENEDEYRDLIHTYRLNDRVEIQAGYVPGSAVGDLFRSASFVVLPYRAGTASVICQMAKRWGRPVIASRTGSFIDEVDDGMNGRLVEPENVDSLAVALAEAIEGTNLDRWHRYQLRSAEASTSDWDIYCTSLQSYSEARGAKGQLAANG